MRIAVLAAVLMLAAPADPAPQRAPWLLFPIDVRRFDRISSPFGVRRLGGHRRLHRGVDLVAPAGSWVVAGGVGALLASIAIVLVSPLSLAGGVRGQEGASLFAADLAVYRAAPPDIRSASLVAAAAAGYEDRAFFRRPRWIPPLSPSGLVRAVVRNLRGIPQGGSTIPQQLAKLYLRTGRRVGVVDKLEA